MSHLPECYKEGSTDSCICDELRACEQRVLNEAREAVVALPMMKIAGNFPLYDADEVIAAIDALRKGNK